GCVERWLHSGEEWLTRQMLYYLRWHSGAHGDRVAENLEPLATKGAPWKARLRMIMEWTELGESRRFFDLFLRLLDSGVLDETVGTKTTRSTFWGALHGLKERHSDRLAEVAAHWLDRQVMIARLAVDEGKPLAPKLDDADGVHLVIQ